MVIADRPHNIILLLVWFADAVGNMFRVPTDRLLEQYFRVSGGRTKRRHQEP